MTMFGNKGGKAAKPAVRANPVVPATDVAAGAIDQAATLDAPRAPHELARLGSLVAHTHPCPDKVADPRAGDAAFVAIDGDPYGRWAVQLTRAQLRAWCRAVLDTLGDGPG